MKIDGKQIAQDILDNLKKRIEKLKKKNITPHLAIILVGCDPASVAYVRQKELKAESIGIKITTLHLPDRTSQLSLTKTIQQFNNDNNIHGIIVQQPLPAYVSLENIINAIDPKKDVDGFRPDSHFQMPITMAVLKILEKVYIYTPRVQSRFRDWLKNKKIAVVGKGETGGKPIVNMFRKLEIEPLIIDSKTKNPELLTKDADIIISAVGKTNVIMPENIKQGVILIGIGLHKEKNGKIIGDYDEKKIKNIASFYTPTPGGVGPINVAMLLKNLVKSPDLLLDKS